MTDILKTLGIRIREHRKKRGLTQDEVADRAGVSQGYIGSVERGEQNLTVESLEKILRAIGMEFDELFCHIDDDHVIDTSTYILNNITSKLQSRSVNDLKFVLQFVDNLISWKDDI